MAHNSSVNFKLMHFLLRMKASHQNPNFETFGCSGKNLPNSLHHLPNHKLVFLQILNHLLASWKITPLYFYFRSNNICFAEKEPIKAKIFETFKLSGHNLSISCCQFWNNKSFPLQILHHSSLSWQITHL